MRILELEIKNWKKHNLRADVKNCSWFKMSNDFFEDPEFFGISGDAQRLWFYLLGRASKLSSPVIKINTQIVANTLRIGVDAVDFAVLELLKTGSLLQKPLTLVSEELEHDRKEKVHDRGRSLEERREEERREEKKREDSPTLPDPKKNLPEINPEEILGHWNSLVEGRGHDGSVIQLMKISEAIARNGDSLSLLEIKQWISNYFHVLNDDKYFYSHKFTCWDFLSRKNTHCFRPGLFEPESFLKFKSAKDAEPKQKPKLTSDQIQLLKEAGQL